MARKKKSAWWKWMLLLLVVIGGVIGWRVYAKRPKNAALDYKTETAARGDITQVVTANGQITPVKNVTVGTQVSGIVIDVLVDFNAHVTNGQVIARIDPSTYEQNISSSEAELMSAKAALEYADLNYKRAKELLANKLIPPSDFEKTVVDQHQAQAVAKMREASLQKSKVDLERTTIYAPIDGVIISRNVEVGQTVAASFNTPTLFQIANDLSKMQIEAMVSEADVGEVEEKQKVNFSVDAFRARQFEGTVRQVRYAAVTNQNVVNYITVVDVANPDLKLRPGMTANASIVTAEKRGVLRIPNTALNFRPPPNAVIKGKTNAPAGSKGGRGGGTNQFAGRGGAGGGGRPDREEMRRRFESMTPEQREQMRAQFRGRSGGAPGTGFGGGSFGGGGARVSTEGPVTRTVYLIDKDAVGKLNPALKAVTVKAGISDGTDTEIIEGLQEGDVVVTGINLSADATTASARPTTPFGSPFGGFRGGGPPRR